MIKHTVIICTCLLAFFNSVFSKQDTQEYRIKNNIVMDADLDGDGTAELISGTQDKKGVARLFYKTLMGYKVVSADKGFENESEDSMTNYSYLTLRKGKTSLLIVKVDVYLDGRVMNGNALMFYEYKNRRLKLIKTYSSFDYDEYEIPPEGSNVVKENEYPYGNGAYVEVLTDYHETSVLLNETFGTSADSPLCVIDNEFKSKKWVMSFPVNTGILAYRVINGQLEGLCDYPGRQSRKGIYICSFWSSGNGKIVDLEPMEYGDLWDIKIDDVKDFIYIISSVDNKKYKATYEFDGSTGKVKKVSNVMIEDMTEAHKKYMDSIDGRSR